MHNNGSLFHLAFRLCFNRKMVLTTNVQTKITRFLHSFRKTNKNTVPVKGIAALHALKACVQHAHYMGDKFPHRLCDLLPPVTAVLYYCLLATGLHDKIISQGVGGHTVYMGIHHPHYTHHPCKYTKMHVITHMWLHAVDMIMHVKLHAVVQLELIKCK